MAVEPDDPLEALAQLEGVPSAMSAARDAVDAVLRDRGRRTVSPEQSAAAMLAAAEASAAIENASVEVDHGTGDRTVPDWTPATVRLYVALTDQAELIRVSPGQAIARTHAVLGRGVLADDDLGRLRPGEEISARMHGLSQLLTSPTRAPLLVLAAVTHAELITTAPFVAGNGIVARAVQHLIMIDGGIDRPPVTVPEVADRESADGYQQALAGYRSGTTIGVRDWLLHVAAGISRGAELSPLKPGT